MVNIIEIASEPILDADPPAQGVNIAGRMTFPSVMTWTSL